MTAIERLCARLARPVPADSLAALRIVFGALIVWLAARYLWNEWPEKYYAAPVFHFKYYGLGWAPEISGGAGLYLLFGALLASGLFVALGLFYRFAAAACFVLFVWFQAQDATQYLNHYYLVALLALLFCFTSPHRLYSLDAWRRPETECAEIAAWQPALFRFQLSLVYLYGALAKVNADWLLYGEPMGAWLAVRNDAGLIGQFAALPGFALAVSWAGFLFDLCVVPALLWRRTRIAAYLTLIVFHLLTRELFQIGLFPWIMIACTPIFFRYDWPQTLLQRLRVAPQTRRGATSSGAAQGGAPNWRMALSGLFALVQCLTPLRLYLYPGDVRWTEQGFRFAWRIMAMQKSGTIEYRLYDCENNATWIENPRAGLTAFQYNMLSTQPDFILQYAHYLAQTHRDQGRACVAVRADARVSLNGAPARPLVDPERDLTRVEDCLLCDRDWILH